MTNKAVRIQEKTAILRLRASPMSVPEKINGLSDLDDKHICEAAFDHLMSSLSSSYGWCKMQVKFLQVTVAGHCEGQGLIGCIKEFCCV